MTAPDLLLALEPVLAALRALGARHYVGGSIASSAHGVPRASIDADVVAELLPSHAGPFAAALRATYDPPAGRRPGLESARRRVRESRRCTLRILALVAALAWAALSLPGGSEPKKVDLGESFDLRVEESARVAAEALEVGFEAVVADSRCPRGEQCIWEGDATVRIWVRKADATKQAYELHTSPKAAVAASHLDYAVRIVRLLPYPTTGRQPAQKGYTATLEVTRGAPPSPDAIQ